MMSLHEFLEQQFAFQLHFFLDSLPKYMHAATPCLKEPYFPNMK